MTETENVGYEMGLEDNGQPRSPSLSRGQIKRVERAKKTRIGLNSNDGADFLGILKVLGSKMVEAIKELTKNLGTKHLIAQKSMRRVDENSRTI
ncbi:hypothetical protein PVK06_029389 [Gossypium arboreum]|uniref:Uncharacterized protein n=1 Tax=Gossypium arboreum TaxID=29729 RepID=A0ABR0P6M3_GOSAR|nr:hypothetical protein PVK06_029389 [Gossypium arboreum]